MYAAKKRQYFVNSYIEGNVDFILGDARAVFENCEIHSNRKTGRPWRPYATVIFLDTISSSPPVGANGIRARPVISKRSPTPSTIPLAPARTPASAIRTPDN